MLKETFVTVVKMVGLSTEIVEVVNSFNLPQVVMLIVKNVTMIVQIPIPNVLVVSNPTIFLVNPVFKKKLTSKVPNALVTVKLTNVSITDTQDIPKEIIVIGENVKKDTKMTGITVIVNHLLLDQLTLVIQCVLPVPITEMV
jgi:hypothetical protein